MRSLTDRYAIRAAARDPALNPAVRAVLTLRFNQLGGTGADLHVVTAADTMADAEAAVGFPLTLEGEPCWEWSRYHPGCTELTFILSDDGPAQVLLLPEDHDLNLALAAIVQATPSGASADSDSEPAS
jgi:hypothetical protein